jgi:hypothetical protein
MIIVAHMLLIFFSSVKAGIRDRTTAFIVSENSWPSFMYENYTADTKNLERGLMKSKLLLMVSNLNFQLIRSSLRRRGSRRYLHLPPRPMKWMAKVMAPIFLRTTDAPKDDQTMLR